MESGISRYLPRAESSRGGEGPKKDRKGTKSQPQVRKLRARERQPAQCLRVLVNEIVCPNKSRGACFTEV